MKLSQLKTIVKEAVKEAIQEEMKDILMEAVRSPKQTVIETRTPPPSTGVGIPGPMNPVAQTPMHEDKRMEMRENIQGILGSMMPGARHGSMPCSNHWSHPQFAFLPQHFMG